MFLTAVKNITVLLLRVCLEGESSESFISSKNIKPVSPEGKTGFLPYIAKEKKLT